MKHEFALISLALCCLPSLACSSPPDDAGEPAACSEAISASPVNNYSFSSTLSFPAIAIQPDTPLTFDWSTVTTDFVGHPFDPMADIDTVNLMLWKLTQEQLQVKLNADDLKQRDLAVIATLYTQKTATSGNLLDFTSVGMPLTPDQILPYLNLASFPPETHTYTVMIASGEVLGAGTRMIQAFRLDPASTNSHVDVTMQSTALDYSVSLHDLEPTVVPGGTGAISIEWKDMTVNALGNEFIPSNITEGLVAHYSQPVSELESKFLDLDLIADEMWRGEIVSGTSVPLSQFTNSSGEAFAGIDGSGTWIVALICGGCRNPAPWYLSILTTCPN